MKLSPYDRRWQKTLENYKAVVVGAACILQCKCCGLVRCEDEFRAVTIMAVGLVCAHCNSQRVAAERLLYKKLRETE